MLKVKKSGFTLVEVILACSMFAIVVSGIVLAINRSFVFMENTKLSVRATNLAREGMEMMYNIRDTNRRRQSGDRDKYWLSVGDLNSFGQLENELYSKGVYVLKEKKDAAENSYIYASKLSNISNIEDFYNDGFWDDSYSQARNNAELRFSGEYSYWDVGEGKVNNGEIQDVLVGDGLKFYRIVRVFGIYEKNVTTPGSRIEDEGAGAEKKTDGTPAEMRFCVKVFYVSQGKHSTELCGVMTNFME